MYCWKCGKNIRDDSKFCSECGSVVSEREEMPYPPRSYDPPGTPPPPDAVINAENIQTQAPDTDFQNPEEELERFAKKLSKPAEGKKRIFVTLFSVAGVIAAVFLVALVPYWIEQGKLAHEYAGAQEFMDDGYYSWAFDAFKELGNYSDSETKAQECRYLEADSDYNTGKLYSAYVIFTELGKYKDSAARAATCELPYPATGPITKYTEPGVVPLTITVPDDGYYTYIKVCSGKLYYDPYAVPADSDIYCTMFMAPGESVTVMVPPFFEVREAYGIHWYGPQEMFGADGSYLVLKPMGSFGFNNSYKLTLRTEYGNTDAHSADYDRF